MYDFNHILKLFAVKKLKSLIFIRNPVGQEEKQGKARFPLAVLSTAEQSTNTLPCGTAKARTRGTGRSRSEAQRKNLFHKQKNTSKRHNRLHKISIFCFAIWKQNIIFATLKNFIWKQNQDSRSNYPTKPKSF